MLPNPDYVSDSDLLTEDEQNELLHWLNAYTIMAFRVGDIARAAVFRAAQRNPPVTQERVFLAVGNQCGRSARTVRYCYETALFFPDQVRQEFDMLPFSHFVTARYLGEQWRAVLEYSAEHVGLSQAALERYFTGGAAATVAAGYGMVADAPDGREIGALSSPASPWPVVGQGVATALTVVAAAGLLTALSTAVDSLRRLLSGLPLRESTRVRLNEALSVLQAALPELSAAAHRNQIETGAEQHMVV